MNEQVFIPAESFRIAQRYCPNFGIFYAVRLLLSIKAEGGAWWQKAAFYTCFTALLLPVALLVDIISLAVYLAYLAVKKMLQILAAATLCLLETIIKKFIGVVLLLAALVSTSIFVYVKWQQITDFIKQLF